jgi:predicted ester cyclase
MDSEAVKSNERRFFAYVNSRDTKSMDCWIDDFVSKDFINHNPTFNVPNNREGLKEMFRMLFKAFPEINFTIKEIIFENNVLCFRHIVHGIRENEGIIGIAMIKFKNEKITARWAFTGPV